MGAQFVGWFGTNVSDVSSSNSINMTSDKSIIARFELIPPVEDLLNQDIPESGDKYR